VLYKSVVPIMSKLAYTAYDELEGAGTSNPAAGSR